MRAASSFDHNDLKGDRDEWKFCQNCTLWLKWHLCGFQNNDSTAYRGGFFFFSYSSGKVYQCQEKKKSMKSVLCALLILGPPLLE